MHKDQVKAICILLVYHSSKKYYFILEVIFGAVHANLRSVYGPLGIVF